jgi:hypothetical protein
MMDSLVQRYLAVPYIPLIPSRYSFLGRFERAREEVCEEVRTTGLENASETAW